MGDFFDGLLVILIVFAGFAAIGFVISLAARFGGTSIRLGATSNIIHPFKTFKERKAEMGFIEKPLTDEEMLKLKDALEEQMKDALEEQTIELNLKDAVTLNNSGLAKKTLEDYRGAIQDFNQAIRLNPNYAEAYNNRGVAKYFWGDKERAIQDCTKAIELNPKYAKAYYNRGNAKISLGDKEGACLDWSKAAKLGDTDAYYFIKQYCSK